MGLESELCVPAGEPATVRVLDGRRSSFRGVLQGFSGNQLRLSLDVPVGARTAVRIDFGALMVLGEVSYCETAGGGCFAGVAVDQCLTISQDLLALCETLRS